MGIHNDVGVWEDKVLTRVAQWDWVLKCTELLDMLSDLQYGDVHWFL